jgi:hypothetical protein
MTSGKVSLLTLSGGCLDVFSVVTEPPPEIMDKDLVNDISVYQP